MVLKKALEEEVALDEAAKDEGKAPPREKVPFAFLRIEIAGHKEMARWKVFS